MQCQQDRVAMMQERRRHPRLIAPPRALVVLPGSSLALPYNMTDISEGGLSFMYLGRSPLSLIDSQLDIYLNEDLQIGKLPVTVVDDLELDGYYIPKRRCSLRFGQLNEDQQQALRRFLRFLPIGVWSDS